MNAKSYSDRRGQTFAVRSYKFSEVTFSIVLVAMVS